jgi:chemotaxis protein CheY-P-specific phosphatase CheC
MKSKVKNMTQPFTISEPLSKTMRSAIQCSAAALGDMVNQEVSIQIEKISLVDQDTLNSYITNQFGSLASLIRLSFSGSTNGAALLLLPEGQDDLLLRAAMPDEQDSGLIAELKPSVLSEAGNVILNACIGTIANELDIQVTYDLPELVLYPAMKEILSPKVPVSDQSLPWLLITSRMHIGTLNITAFILVVCQPSILVTGFKTN